ncbi:MAG: hypothetical protein IJB01_04875 [Bacteroidaceae bacterium]|nr:hypothetical protein [Bacteroidaceae bacterium]
MKDESGKMKETMLLATLTTYAAMRKEKGERRNRKCKKHPREAPEGE